jgi:branched-chain amino acid transport system substrate-binding protein
MERSWKALGLLAAMSLLLAGCTVSPAATRAAAEAAASESIQIGALYGVTGGMSSIDQPGLDGFKLAAEQINASGGIAGRRIEVVAIDGQSDQTATADAAAELIEVHKVAAIGGLNDTTFALAAGPVAQAAGIPFVTAGATLPTLPEEIGDFFFMAAFGDDAQAHAIADYAMNVLGGASAYILVDEEYAFTTALARFFRERWEANGGAVVLEDVYRAGATDFSAQIARVQALDPQPDVIFIAAVPNEAGITTAQFRAAGLTQPILSGDGFDTPLLGEVAGENADAIYYATHVSLDNDAENVQDFVQSYTAAYGRPPENAFAALGYDTMNLIADAIDRAGSADPAAIRNALAATQGFQAVTGVISYPEGQRKPHKSVTIIQVQDGIHTFAAEVQP